jgi:hypothetical protein
MFRLLEAIFKLDIKKYIYIYTLLYVQPEEGLWEPKHVTVISNKDN